MRAETLTGLAAVQRLDALVRRATLRDACALTDRARESHEDGIAIQTAALEALDEVFAGRLLCPDRMMLAAHAVTSADERVSARLVELDDAEEGERDARQSWLLTSQRADWFSSAARRAHRLEARKKEIRAIDEATSLRLAIGKGWPA